MSERKENKFVAVVALARKIAGVIYALLRDGCTYQAQRASTVRAEPVTEAAVVAGGPRPVGTEAHAGTGAVDGSKCVKGRGPGSRRGRPNGSCDRRDHHRRDPAPQGLTLGAAKRIAGLDAAHVLTSFDAALALRAGGFLNDAPSITMM